MSKHFKIIFLLFIYLLEQGCNPSSNCDINISNSYLPLTDNDFKNIKKINELVLKHKTDIITNNYSDSTHTYLLTTYLLTKSMKSDSLEFVNVIGEFASNQSLKKTTGFDLGYILVDLNNNRIDYRLRDDICNNGKDMIVYHKILYCPDSSFKYDKYRRNYLVKEKTIESNWTYYIENEEYLGR